MNLNVEDTPKDDPEGVMPLHTACPWMSASNQYLRLANNQWTPAKMMDVILVINFCYLDSILAERN